jgi:S-DNA-T family DNA segregation ATPase FtsK/SpoIIIE
MAEKGNSFRKNTPGNTGKRSTSPRPRMVQREASPFFKDGVGSKIVKVIGLLLLIFSVYFLIAFTSYLFTWEEDQSYVSAANGGWSTLLKSKAELETLGVENSVVQNWMGKFGALLAHQFLYKWFGISSFVLVAFLFIIGYRMLFKVRLLSIWKLLGYTFFSLLFISLTLAYFHSYIQSVPHYLEGEFGYWTNRMLLAQLGSPGVAGLLLFVLLTTLIVFYNLDVSTWLKAKQRSPKEEEEPELKSTPQRYTPESEYKIDPVEFNVARARNQQNEQPVSPRQQESQTDLSFDSSPVHTAPNTAEYDSPISSLPTEPKTQGPLFELDEKEEESVVQPDLSINQIHEEKPITASDLVQEFGLYDPKLELSGYKHPTLDLLKDYGTGKITINNQELEANKDKIVETLGNYNIEIAKIKATIGPTVTLYEIIPKPGVRISKIKNLEDDIALSLAALGIRIIAPMPGKGTIGIEVPNSHPEMVSMRSVLMTEKFQHTDMDLPIALGRTISNEVYIADLAKMPHLLVAGATGQGKSVGINAILTSLLYKKHPAELKFVLVDPKKVELSLFKKVERHFLAKLPGEEDAIITDTKKVINTLNSLCIEMDQRYDLLKNAQVRNLKEYNAKFVNRRLNPEEGHRFLPFIVLIVDEFADLMMTAGKEVETPIARLAQLARAVGIHLVIATQRPSVNIITGTIKANFPARLAFRVLSKVDSRTILDSGGADQLIGRGDMLLATGSDLIRIQCAFVDTPEVEEISDFIGNQKGYPSAFLLPEYVDENGDGNSLSDFDMSDRDAMFEEAARLIVMHQQGSTSLIQRKLKLGYNRAGRIIDQLEAAGIVGPFEGSKAREVLYPDEYSLEQFLDELKKDQK